MRNRVPIVAAQPALVAGGALTLVEVDPARRAGARLHPDEDRFGFRWDPRDPGNLHR